MAATRSQSVVSDGFEVERLLMSLCLSRGNQVRALLSFNPDDEDYHPVQQTIALQSLLAVCLTIVFLCDQWGIEKRLTTGKIDPMRLDIG